MKLSPHFALTEFTHSQTAARLGIKNVPNEEEIANLKALANVLEQVRIVCMRNPIIISSGFRSAKINRLVGGSSSSQHMLGQAADFTIPGFGHPFDVCAAIIKANIPFDQLIYEYESWVHMSVTTSPRRQVLSKFIGSPYLAGLRTSATSEPLAFKSESK